MDQSHSWDEFRNACSYAFIPGENMVWADQGGNIGWQAVGIAPIRKTWSGLVPVPGDGRFEWAGYLRISEKPHILNPPSGFIATANNDLIPPGYTHPDAVGYVWADPFRWQRIIDVLDVAHGLTIADMTRLQTDYLSLPAKSLVPLLAPLTATKPEVERARRALLDWNFVLDANSVPAGIYEAWFRLLEENTRQRFVPAAAQPFFPVVSTQRLIEWLTTPPVEFGDHPAAVRDSLLLLSLDQGVADLTRRFGADQANWKWGQVGYHHALITHPLSPAVSDDIRRRLDVGPVARGGDGNTVGATGGSDNQLAGASFRIVADLGDWDATLGINNPGQSGDPESPHYRDLFALWAEDKYFPVAYSRARVETVAESVTMLQPPRPLTPTR
jgi:penicillin amidase